LAFTSVEISHQFSNADGTAASGTVEFTLSGRMTNGTQSIMKTAAVTVALDGTGSFTKALPANDDAGTVPVGVQWLVALRVAGADEETYEVTVPSAAPGHTVDLGSLLPSAQQVG
jgi:hypothetical protein